MGLLDDAIREHLDLKRKHGAGRDDVERLEKEAFGPPTRPGDPDFEEGEGEPSTEAAREAAAAAPAAEPGSEQPEAPSEELEAAPGGFFDGAGEFDDEDAAASSRSEVPAAEPPSTEQPLPAAEEEWGDAREEGDWSEHEVVGFEPDSEQELTPAEQARREHAELGDTVDHPALPESEQDPAAEPESGEEPAEPAETSIFSEPAAEEGEDDMLADIDFDLDLGAEPTPSERPDGPATAERPADSGTAERPAVPAEGGSTEDDEGYVEGDEEGFEGDDVAEDDLEDEDEDLLEETPDFLQDAPEGERLWFEQGEPRDFDYDD